METARTRGYGIPEWLAGSKRVQVKGGYAAFGSLPLENTDRQKPFGKSGLNTFLEKAVERMVLEFLKVAGFWRK